MALMKKMTLLKRTIIWLSAISFVIFFLLVWIVWQVRETVRDNGLLHIQKILNHKLDTIDMYVDERYSALNNLTQLLYVALHYQNTLEYDYWDKVSNDLDGNLEIFANNNHFYDIFLIMTNGDIALTVKNENDLHTNLLSGPYRHTQLGRVFRDALKNSKPQISDFYYYVPSHDNAAFIAQPIIAEGKIIAVVAVQIDKKAIYSVINDYSELGQTGQVFASVIREGKLMSMIPMRHSNIKPYTFFDSPENKAIRNAVKGGKGQAYMVDRLGHDVVIAWDYQHDLHWGLAIQIDESELLASWYTMSTFLTLLFFSGVLIVGFMLIMAFRSFVKPIRELTRNAQMMSEGHYDIPLDSEEYDQEWQLLIRVFKQMSVEISHRITQLNDQNELLTMQKNEIKELNLHLEAKIETKSKQLQEYINIVDQYVITSQTDVYGVITYVSEAFCQISGYTKEELIGQNHRIVRHPDMPNQLFIDLWKTITSGKIWHGEIKNSTSDGKYHWLDTMISPNFEDEKIIGYTAVRQDITNQKMIEELAITDSMTGLYNR
ncbi:MAG: PAS domain S-box protein, partial [Sulfuricurvum sp.]|nr:PAS domain S-box protein [Sulfuricurvum sp.]